MQEKSDRAAWLKGGEARCNIQAKTPVHPYRLVLLGAPGVGKGTQGELLHRRLGACPLSTGDVFRAAKSLSDHECSASIIRALGFMRRGELVPDEIVLSLVRERGKCLQCRGGFLLDGFPRTVAQAEALEKILIEWGVELDAVISYELPLEIIVARLGGRRVCSKCKTVYHVETLPPKTAGICDQCGQELFQREDDRPEAIRVRMDAYEKSTAPLADFYRRKGLLLSIPAGGVPEKTLERTLEAIRTKRGEFQNTSPEQLSN